MTKTLSIAQLRKHLDNAKVKISLEKSTLLSLYPLKKHFSREEYAFAYVRAERLGMRSINRRLKEIEWLPMKLDPRSEMLGDARSSMKKWVTNLQAEQPNSDEFGNDFIHVIARGGIECGWDSPSMITLMIRVGNLFRDLSCLIGLLYYCSWLEDNNIEFAYVSNPEDLNRTAEEVTALIQSPEIYRFLRAKEQNDQAKAAQEKLRAKPKTVAKKPPQLRVIENTSFFDPYVSDPLMV